MKKVGEVSVILNDKFAVIKSIEPLILGSEILVYTELGLNEEIKAKSGLADIMIPKGKLKVVMLQQENVYLVSIVTQRSAENTNENQSLGRSLSLYTAIFGQDKPQNVDAPVEGEVIAPYSAKLDTTQAINTDFNSLVQVGDPVAFSMSL